MLEDIQCPIEARTDELYRARVPERLSVMHYRLDTHTKFG